MPPKGDFYGLKVHMVVTTDKEPVMVHISEGSIHDITAGHQFMHHLPKESITIGDKGYVSSKLEAFLKRFDIVLFFPPPLGAITCNEKIQKIILSSVELEKA